MENAQIILENHEWRIKTLERDVSDLKAVHSEIDSFNDVVLSTFISITQGILLAGASVYTSQLYVQSKKE